MEEKTMRFDEMDAKMRIYEQSLDQVLLPDIYMVARLDGRGFTKFMCLIHDVVEIDAGDTYAYDFEGLKTQKVRENKAKERIFSLLPDDQKAELIALFDEFEAYDTPES